MRQRQWLAVRCCCTPGKILGFLPVDLDRARIGSHWMLDRSGNSREIRILPLAGPGSRCRLNSDHVEVNPLYSPTEELAIYSDDHPVEFWRNFHDFIEAKEQVEEHTYA